MTSYFDVIQRCVEEERPVVAVTVIEGDRAGARMLVFDDGSTEGSLGEAELDVQARREARAALQRGAPRRQAATASNGASLDLFYDVYPSPPTLLIFGGVHVGVPLASFAKQMGFRVRVIDARGRFANAERFPSADEIVTRYADEYLADARVDSSTYVVVLSHDPKLDDPALLHVVRTPARYIGAIGSRQTNEKRRARLREAGLADELIDRIHAPIGLNIGADTPDEIALAILAEMIAAKNGRDVRPLPEVGSSEVGSRKAGDAASAQATPISPSAG
jgi:xanthine dehydrogenase accessory factor